MAQSSLNQPADSASPPVRYLTPSIFWGIREELPTGLSTILSVVSLAVPLALWAIMSYGGLVSPLYLPTPSVVLQAGVNLFQSGDLVADILSSCGRVGGGFLLAALVGVPLGIAMGTFTSMERLFAPLVGTIRYMPVTGFVPLIVLWVGLGEDAKVWIIFLGVFLYNAIMVADAVKFIPSEMINVAYTLGANRRDVLFKVILPATFPSVLDTLRVNIAAAWVYLVIAELVAAQNGLGFRIVQAQRVLQTEKALFCIAVIGLIGVLSDFGLKWVSQRLTPWADQTRH